MLPSISYPTEKSQVSFHGNESVGTIQVQKLTKKLETVEKKRLIFLVPPSLTDEVEFGRYILDEAQQNDADVVLLMLVSNYEDESHGHLKVSTINALLTGFHFYVDTMIVWGKSWEKAIKQILEPRDVIICPADMKIRTHLIQMKPISDELVRILNNPVKTYSGFTTDNHFKGLNFLKKVAFWLGILAIISGFFWIEATGSQLATGWVSQFIEIILVFIEIGAIYFWCSILG